MDNDGTGGMGLLVSVCEGEHKMMKKGKGQILHFRREFLVTQKVL